MIYIVTNSKSNFFINELLLKLSNCLRSLGFDNQIVLDEFPSNSAAQYIFVPHEWFNQQGERKLPNRKILARAIGLITENPGSPWFEECKSFSQLFPKYLFINKSSLDVYPASIEKKYFIQLFNEPSGKTLDFEEWRRREFTFAFLGGDDQSRRKKLAELSPIIAGQNSYINLTATKISSTPSGGQIFGSEFEDILSRSKVLINLHRENTHSIEWQRILLANSIGTVVLTEPSLENESKLLPWLVKEFESVRKFSKLTESEQNLFDFAKEALEVSSDLKNLNALNELGKFLKRKRNISFRIFPYAVRKPKDFLKVKRERLQVKVFHKVYSLRWYIPEYKQVLQTFEKILSSQKTLVLDNIRMRRMIENMLNPSVQLESDYEIVHENLSAQIPLFTIAITIYNEGELLKKCIDSVKNLEVTEQFDVVVCSDAGNQVTLETARRELLASNLSFRIIKRVRNGGVGASRNTILQNSRGKYSLMLDGDNTLFPKSTRYLIDALEENPGAFFSYGLLSVKERESYIDLMNFYAWDINLFRGVGNFIDALTLLDREKILAIGGFSDSLNLYGWEDFDLWARIADVGGYGAQTKNFVATYSRRANSMISTTDVDTNKALAEIRERSPSIWQ
jgi:Glycosyl transferase family 2